MRVKVAIAFMLVLAAGLLLTVNVMSEEKKMTDEEMMAIYMKYAAPGEAHKALDPLVGSWDFVTRWWTDPATPPQESKGICESKWILGGRFVQEDVSGDMMGAPFHGMGLTGHDNYKKQYISYWFDEMSTCGMMSTGTADATRKVINFTGSWDDMATGKVKNFKAITRIINNDQHVYEMYDFGEDGKEWKSFEVSYTRKK